MMSKKSLTVTEALMSIKAFLPKDSEIVKIIEICQLHPQDNSWRLWSDYQGHYLNFAENGKISSGFDDNKIIFSDLYHSAPLHKISQFSTWAFIVLGEHEQQNVIFLWLLGQDQWLRLFYFNQVWLRSQPLSCGIYTLRVLAKNFDVTDFNTILNSQLQGPIPIKVIKAYATIWPPTNNFKQEMFQTNQQLTEQIYVACQLT